MRAVPYPAFSSGQSIGNARVGVAPAYSYAWRLPLVVHVDVAETVDGYTVFREVYHSRSRPLERLEAPSDGTYRPDGATFIGLRHRFKTLLLARTGKLVRYQQ